MEGCIIHCLVGQFYLGYLDSGESFVFPGTKSREPWRAVIDWFSDAAAIYPDGIDAVRILFVCISARTSVGITSPITAFTTI